MMEIILLFIIPTLIVGWVVIEIVKTEKEHKEFKERLKKAKPLTGVAKEVFKGTICAK